MSKRNSDQRHWDAVQHRANQEARGETPRGRPPKNYEHDRQFVAHRPRPGETHFQDQDDE